VRAVERGHESRMGIAAEKRNLEIRGSTEVFPRKTRQSVDDKVGYSVKRDEKGNIMRYKARLVIHGFNFGFEYWDTYSPVVRIITTLLVLLMALLLGLDGRHVVVGTTLLNSTL
jgi:hypothetical protein